MAVFNEILEGGLNLRLARRLAMQTAAPASALQPEIVPAIVLENDRPEYGALASEYRFSKTAALGAPGAGLHNFFSLQPNLNGGSIAVIESLIVSTECLVTLASVSTGSAGTSSKRDFRAPSQSSYIPINGTVLTASIPAANHRTFANMWDYTPWIAGVLIQDSFSIITTAAATALTFTVTWRERPVNPSELG